MASKLLYWFKSYGNFAELVDFAYWWSCIGKGLSLQPAHKYTKYNQLSLTPQIFSAPLNLGKFR